MLTDVKSSFFSVHCEYPLEILYHEIVDIVKHFVIHWDDVFRSAINSNKRVITNFFFGMTCMI